MKRSSGVFNFAKFSSCTGYDTSWVRETLEPTSYVVYPTINNITRQEMQSYKEFANYTLGRVKVVSEQDASNYESVLQIQPDKNPQLSVRVIRNEKFVARSKRKRASLPDTAEDKPAESVLIVLLDALSRQQFVRSLPKSFKYLEEVSLYSDFLDVHSFLKFHSIRAFTGPNCEPLRYGVSFEKFKYVRSFKLFSKLTLKFLTALYNLRIFPETYA